MFDGKDYPVTGDPESDARSYRKIDDRTMEFWVKKGGKVMASGKIIVAPDGKSRTVTTTGNGAERQKVPHHCGLRQSVAESRTFEQIWARPMWPPSTFWGNDAICRLQVDPT